MFLQATPPIGQGPILIEGIYGDLISKRINQLAADNAFELMLIGLVETTTPIEIANAIAEAHAASHLHDGWFAPSADLLAYVQHVGQTALEGLLASAHPGWLGDEPVDIKAMADILGVSVQTVRRMCKAGEIPFMRWGSNFRFVPADVIATLNRR